MSMPGSQPIADSLFERFGEFAKRHSLIKPGERVLVGISGGKDSMFGVELLRRWSVQIGFTLEGFMSRVPPHLYASDPAYAACESYVRALGIPLRVLSADVDDSDWTEDTACAACKDLRRGDGARLARLSSGAVIAGCFTLDDLQHYAFSLLHATAFRRGLDAIADLRVRTQFERRLARFVPRARRLDGGYTIYPVLPFRASQIQPCLEELGVPYGTAVCRFGATTASGARRIQCQPPQIKHGYGQLLALEYEQSRGELELLGNLRNFTWEYAGFTSADVVAWPD